MRSVSKSRGPTSLNAPITAQIPSFSRMWSEPVPKDSSPQMERRPASIRFPKNFQPKFRFSILLQLVARDLTSRDLEVLETLLFGNEVDGSASWHAPSQTLDTTLLEVRNRIGPIRNDGNRIAGGNKCALSVDHITITVTIGGCTKGDVVLFDSLDQGVSICQVGVGVSSTEVGRWDTVLCGRFEETELVDEDSAGVWTGNTVQTIEKNPELLSVGEEVLDQVEVENRFEELDVFSDGINDLNLQRTVSGFSNHREVDLEVEVSR